MKPENEAKLRKMRNLCRKVRYALADYGKGVNESFECEHLHHLQSEAHLIGDYCEASFKRKKIHSDLILALKAIEELEDLLYEQPTNTSSSVQ